MTIPAGQQVAVVGATGSGKTTLGRLIARFADPTVGELYLGGVPLQRRQRRPARSPRRGLAGAVHVRRHDRRQHPFAKPNATRDDIEAVVERLEVGDWVSGCATASTPAVGERGEQLSAGERQLVALLRAGVADPDVLVLDEATSSVDALTEVRISRALSRLAAGRTTIAIAHRLSTAARADRVLVLQDGRLVEDGHHDQLVTAGGTYTHLYDAWLSATTT